MSAPVQDTSAWLVATKLRPPFIRSDTIARPRLEEMLVRSVGTLPFTLLSAPAGYGKTTLLAALPRLLPGIRVAWVTLDVEDNDPIRFVSLLAAALQELEPESARSVWPLLTAGASRSEGLKRAVVALINGVLGCFSDPIVLVLDDLHTVTEPAVHIALEYLLDHQPPQLHLAIGTRFDPPLRLARLAARGQLAELRRSDLGFNHDEARQLLNDALGMDLTPPELAALEQRTEGWPAGLCLLAGPLGRMEREDDRTRFVAALAGMERYALDFLAEEVLRDLPDDIRDFLIQTSVLAEMTPSACRAVTGREDAAEVLENLYRRNLTIVAIASGSEEPVYRHHALFARLLAHQLEREQPSILPELHRRAAGAQKTPGRAISHYLSAGLWDEAALLMEQSGMALLHRGMSETVRHWYDALPAPVQAGHPRLSVLMGRCEIHAGNYASAGLFLSRAREIFIAGRDEEGEGEALASLLTLAYQNDDRAAAGDLVRRAAELPLTPLGSVAVRLARAWLNLSKCDWRACRDDIREALAIPRASGNRSADLIGITYMSAPLAAVPGCIELTEQYCAEAGALAPAGTAWRLGADELGAWPLLWRGHIEKALACAEESEDLRRRLGGFPFVGNDVAVILNVIYAARGDCDASARAVDTLVSRIPDAPRGKWPFYLHAAGRGLAFLGRLDDAGRMQKRLAGLPQESPLTQYLAGHLAGLIALLQGCHQQVGALLEQAAQLEATLPIAWVGGSARLLQARLFLEKRSPDAAAAAIEPVLNAWNEAGTPGCALLDGPAGLPIIEFAAGREIEGARRILSLIRPELAHTQAARPVVAAVVSAEPSALLEPLTQREREVLGLIVAGQTNRQVGQTLFIAEETVKSHVVHILRKLGVTSRTQAAIRGRELGF